jgi:hypothetical protein
MKELDNKLKRKIGAIVVLGIFAALLLAQPVAADISMTDDEWIGFTGGAQIIFDSTPTPDDIEMMNASVGIGDKDPDFKLFIINNNGDVGIGTASPGSKLEIKSGGPTHDSSALHVKNSASTSLLFVRDDGNIGIGVTNPAEKLEIDGNILFNTGVARTIYIETPSSDLDGNDLTIYSGNAFDLGGLTGNDGGDFYLRAGNGDCNLGQLSGGNGGDVFVYGGDGEGSEGLDGDVILAHTGSVARGMVGIGTATPYRKLDILDTSGLPQLRLSYNTYPSYPRIHTDFTTTSSGYLFIDPSGDNVGIGTPDPDHQLHLLSIGFTDCMLKIDAYTAGYESGIRLAEADTDKWFISNDGDDSDKLKIASDGGIASETRFTIHQDGNVGIGTVSPDTELHVNGDIKQKVTTSDVAIPPTDAELDTLFGTPASNGDGWTAYLKDTDSSNFYQIVAVGTEWYIFTAAVA